jgi:tRNA threonylcarbamoyladenosine biosynthesis protein TsaB
MAELILLLETSGEQCSVAVAEVLENTGKVLAEAEHTVPMKHTAMLLPLIREAFAKTPYTLQDTSAVAVSTGPGSYTALRAGYSSAKGLCMALDIPMITVSTLKALATCEISSHEKKDFERISVLPARRNDVYFARFDRHFKTLIAPVCVEANAAWWQAQFGGNSTLLVSPQFEEFVKKHGQDVEGEQVELRASNLLEISIFKYTTGDFADAASVEPNYVKPPFITVAKPRL